MEVGGCYYTTEGGSEDESARRRRVVLVRAHDSTTGEILVREEGSFETEWILPHAASKEWTRIDPEAVSSEATARLGVAFESDDLVNKELKVWWDDDAYFYPGVVMEKRVLASRDDGSGGGGRPVRQILVKYFDIVEEWVDFDSPNVFWAMEGIHAIAPKGDAAVYKALGGGGKAVNDFDCATSAIGWRVGVREGAALAAEGGTSDQGGQPPQYAYGFVVHSELGDSGGSGEAARGKVIRLTIHLDDGREHQAEASATPESNYTWPRDFLSGSADIVWLYPSQMTLDLYSYRFDAAKHGPRAVASAIYWDPEKGFEPTRVDIWLMENKTGRPIHLAPWRCTGSRAQDRRGTLDLRTSMVQWIHWKDNGLCPPPKFFGTKNRSRDHSGIESGGEVEGGQRYRYHLFGRSFALVPFVGHSRRMGQDVVHKEESNKMIGMRILATKRLQEKPVKESRAGMTGYVVRFGIVLSANAEGIKVLFDNQDQPEWYTWQVLEAIDIYTDIVGRAGDLERTSSCLPLLLPIEYNDEPAHFMPSRGLVIHRGFGMSPQHFVQVCQHGSSPPALKSGKWQDLIHVKQAERASDPSASAAVRGMALGKWLALYRVDVTKTVYWELVSSELRNWACKVDITAGDVEMEEEEEVLEVQGGEGTLYSGPHANALEPEKRLNALMLEKIGGDKVLVSLYMKWVKANSTKFCISRKDRSIKTDLGKVGALLKEVTESSHELDMVHESEYPALRASYVAHCQTYEALCHIKEYLIHSKSSTSLFADNNALDLLIKMLEFIDVKASHGVPFRNEASAFAFERRQSIFQLFWMWARDSLPQSVPNPRKRQVITFKYLKASKVLKYGSCFKKVEPQRPVKPQGAPPAPKSRPAKSEKLAEAVVTKEESEISADAEYVIGVIKENLKDRPKELDRVLKYLQAQRRNFGIVRTTREDGSLELQKLQRYCRKLLEKGPSAKSTSINWLIKYLEKSSWDSFQGKSTIELTAQFIKWLIKVHMPEPPPQSFFKYKAYWPYFWSYFRGGLGGIGVTEEDAPHSQTGGGQSDSGNHLRNHVASEDMIANRIVAEDVMGLGLSLLQKSVGHLKSKEGAKDDKAHLLPSKNDASVELGESSEETLSDAMPAPSEEERKDRKRKFTSPAEEGQRPTCLLCNNPCAVHRRDRTTDSIISWRCRNCKWQGLKAQEKYSKRGDGGTAEDPIETP